MKRLFSLLHVLALASLILTACATHTPERIVETVQVEVQVTQIVAGTPIVVTATPAPAEPTSAFKMAVILTGPPDDNSWNEAGYNAIQAMKGEGVEIAFSESVSDADVARVERQYADQGFQMIVAHSFGFGDPTFQVAQEYPNVNFAWAGGIKKTAKNVADYDQPFYEASYLIGIIGGHVSQSGQFGALYGFDIPVCHAMGEAFLAGAKTVNPDAALTVTAVGDWIDVAKAKEAALAQADTGVDFWIECGEGPALGAIEAAQERNGYVVGYVGDMSENGPESVVVSLVWNMVPMFKQMKTDTQAGAFDNPWYVFGVKEDAMQLVYNPALKDKVPQEALDQIEQVKQQIIDGSFTVPYVPAAQ